MDESSLDLNLFTFILTYIFFTFYIVEKDACIAKIVLNIFLLIFGVVALYGTTGGLTYLLLNPIHFLLFCTGKAFFILPFIVYEFLSLLLFITVVVLVVLVLGVYSPGGVDVTTTVSVGVIGAMSTGNTPFLRGVGYN